MSEVEILPPLEEEAVELRLLYDAFAPSTVEIHELVFQPGLTLDGYLDGLPPEAEWMVFVNGREVALADAPNELVNQGDKIGLILVPQGGDSVKSLLRIALVAAVAVVGALTGNVWIIAAVAIGAGLINTFLLTPKPPKQNAGDTSSSYGIDGAKNSATENIVYPVWYGEYRVAGNFGDVYTENVGDVQYLYLRAILNDGEIEGLYDIEINEQPLANFTDIQTRISKGTLTEGVNDWFGRSIRQVNKSIKIDTGWTIHQTQTEVDQIRWDVVFSQGLVDIDEKKGTYRARSVNFEMEYRQLDPVTKQPVTDWTGANGNPSNYMPGENASEIFGVPDAVRVGVGVSGKILNNVNLNLTGVEDFGLEYRVDGGNWIGLAPQVAAENTSTGYVFDGSGDGSIAGETDITPASSQYFEFDVPDTGGAGVVDVRATNGTIDQVVTYPAFQTGRATATDNRTRQIRRSFESGPLNRAYYEARIRRTSVTSTSQYQIDEVYLTDVAEIQAEQVALRGTANLALRIKLTEQLNQIPQVTGRLRASLLQEYDVEGNPTVRRWSGNCAWVGLDILCGAERGAGTPKEDIDWPAWVEFAEHCRINNLNFNGGFEEGTNIGDALQQVLRVGHAAPVPMGRKISVVIDRPRDPVTAFGQGNIIKGTFEISYLSVSDRANEFEVSYFDKNDRNKQKTIRYVDPKAVTFNEAKRTASVTLIGVDNIEQARAELWRNVYMNRLLIRSINFETGLESINLIQGENALIAHNMMEWSQSGRTAAGSTISRVQLDQPVTLEPGLSYGVLVHYDAIAAGSAVVSNVIGRRITVPTQDFLDPQLFPARATVGDVDVELIQVVKGNPYDTVLLETAAGISAGDTVTFWDTDVLVERNVKPVAAEVTQSFVDLAADLPEAPTALRNFIFGETRLIRKPYTMTGLSGTGVVKRRLSFMEYDERVYGPPELEIPTPVAALSDRAVGHVQTLLFDYERLVEANRSTINARLHWSAAGIRNYAGADLYMALNGGELRPIGSALNVTEYLVALNPGDVARFKAVAYNKRGDRAPMGSAPSVSGTIAVTFATLDAPEDLDVIVTNFETEGTVQTTIMPPADTTGIMGYEVQYKRKIDGNWNDLGVYRSLVFSFSGLQTGTYQLRARSTSDTSLSAWVAKEFLVAVRPGSLMANFLSSNDRNADPISAPTTSAATDVEHTLNTDGSANVSFEYGWDGDEATIDGFEVIWSTSDS